MSGCSPPLGSLVLGKPDVDKEEDVKRIQFSGGGNTFSMELSKEKMWDKITLSDWDGRNRNQDISMSLFSFDAAIKVMNIGPEITLKPYDLTLSVNHESNKQHTQTNSATVDFVLGDDNPGDEFVIDLYFDKKFGTIVFDTVAGRSKCPHETGTAAIDDPRLTVLSRPGHVFPDEDMVYEVEMTNVGVGEGAEFVLYAQQRDNEGSLKLFLDGEQLTGNREFSNILKDTSYRKTLVVQKGPRLFEYASLDLSLESSCGGDSDSIQLYNNLVDRSIEFVKPCPKVEWVGEMRRDQYFVVNLDLVVLIQIMVKCLLNI